MVNRKGKKVLLVDGYNVIRAGRLGGQLAQQSPDYAQDTYNAAREALLSNVSSFAGSEYQATVVFDGAENQGSRGEMQSFGSIAYLFSPYGVSADTVIERLANKAAQEGKEVLVVSSDATIQSTVFGRTVTRMSASGFCREIESLQQDFDDFSLPGRVYAQKNTLAERIDPEVSEKLRRLVRKDVVE
ncbi:MAG: NYN domain-containing protein [Coriobacteriales bacterium]|jgi:predicted RNA-binding protein with PIN domain|nr:NYN domain-containing protein [Coriobacteriales bacterium]